MKKILILSLILFLLVSCGGNNKEQGIIEEAVEITDGYVETLEETPAEARELKQLLDKRNEGLQDKLDELKQ